VIDLHTHTYASDGTDAPAQLVELALERGVEALAITDHDTFAGYDEALPVARTRGLDLICGVELSCKFEGRSPHLLGYFLQESGADAAFREWVNGILESRRARNRAMIAQLQKLGVTIELSDVEAVGRSVTGRPHFAKVLIDRGYATDRQDAFDRLIGESGSAFIERQGPTFEEALGKIHSSGGISSLAHPIRLGLSSNPDKEAELFDRLRLIGLDALEVWHTDHKPALVKRYANYAERHGMLMTGGSDYHGDNKPNARLGGVMAPLELVEAMRADRTTPTGSQTDRV
jgi:predicted metal-dependent phosphoesterase TrpH